MVRKVLVLPGGESSIFDRVAEGFIPQESSPANFRAVTVITCVSVVAQV